jgi:hypothetical protein
MKKRSSRRPINPTVIVSAPARVSTTTRLRPSSTDEAVLCALGEWYAREVLWAFRRRNVLGTNYSKQDRAWLKRELTARGMSSRWAGAILGEACQHWRSGRSGLARHITSLKRRCTVIDERLVEDSSRPYPRAQRRMKRQRLDHLRGKLARAQAQYASGRVSYCRGGTRLARARLHLAETVFADRSTWRAAWKAQRQRTFSAAGEPGKTGGNETIRVSVGGYLEIDLPAALCGHANQPRGRYRLATPITFTHRRQEHENAATTRHSIGYRVRYDAARERWYVDASFSPTHPDRPSDLQAIRASGIVSVDLNEHHVSVAQVNAHGNLAARPFDLPLDLSGPTSRRDAQLRDAFSLIIAYAKQHDCAVAIEDLNFEDEKTTSRESYRKRFRRVLAGLPTGIVRERLRSMTATAGVPLLAADPAYTSKDGRAHWAKPLDLTTHQAAALCIGRRALDLRLSRRACTPAPDQRIEAGEQQAVRRSGPITRTKSAQAHPGTITRQTSARAHAARTRDPGMRDRSSRPKTVRGRRRSVAGLVSQNSTV